MKGIRIGKEKQNCNHSEMAWITIEISTESTNELLISVCHVQTKKFKINFISIC